MTTNVGRASARVLLAPVLVWALAGCPYVSRGELEAQLDRADEDGDGVSVGDGDCDDAEPEAYPGNPEVPYDGIDNDCVGGDLVDVDGDGHDVDVDCDDTDPDVFPSAVDEPYDGVNADCRDNHDFDQDGDGWLVAGADADEVADYEATWGAGSVPILGGGDCNDLSRAVNPGVVDDPWYDGVDSDCDGADDFDADGDGYPLELDCLDQADESLEPGVDPADVHPDADDPPYDGVDSDCARDDDFDADGDGWVREGDEAAHADYIDRLGLSEPAGYDDCADDDDTIHPGALERLDGVNQDCGGGGLPGDGDATGLHAGSFTWEAPRTLRGATVQSDPELFVLGALADRWNAVDDAAVLLTFDEVQGLEPLPSEQLELHNQPGELLDDGFDLLGGPEILAATVDARDFGTTSSHLVRLEASAGELQEVDDVRWSFAGGSSEVDAVSVADTGKTTWLWSCRDASLQVTEQPAQLSAVAELDAAPSTCVVGDDPSTATVCGTDGCETWQYSPGSLSLAPQQPLAGFAFSRLRRHGELLVGVNDGEVVIDGLGPLSLGIDGAVAADAVAEGATLYLLVATDDGGLTLHHGLVGEPLTEVPFAPPGPVDDVALALGDDALLLGVVSEDAVHWAFLGR